MEEPPTLLASPGPSSTSIFQRLPIPSDAATSASSSNAGSRASTPATPLTAPPPPPHQHHHHQQPPAVHHDKKEIERRVLPARLRRVSSLLAGGAIDEDFLNGMDKGDAPVLPLTTRIVLSSYSDWPASFAAPDADDLANDMGFFSSAELARACRARETIETPDFRARDDSEVLGKTRGSRVEEDTSDAAYERRHQRPDKLEKKQRRLEKERLVKEKHKLEDRIEQLRLADARLLMPILVAREQRGGIASTSFSSRGAEVTFGLGRSNMSSEASANMQRLEALRQDLLGEANETLRRYEALLPEEPAPATSASLQGSDRRKRLEDDSAAEESDSTSGAAGAAHSKRVTMVRDAAQRRASANARDTASSSTSRRASSGAATASTSLPRSRLSDSAIVSREARAGRRSDRLVSAPSTPASGSRAAPRSKRSPTPKPKPKAVVVPKGTTIHAEANHINIHARTSGGRFAPKAALAVGKAKEALQPRARRADGSLLSKAATQRILEAQREREKSKSREAGGSPSGSANASAVQQTPSPSTSRVPQRPTRQRNSHEASGSSSSHKRTKSESGEPLTAARSASSPAENDVGERKPPKRLRLVLGSRNRAAGEEVKREEGREVKREGSTSGDVKREESGSGLGGAAGKDEEEDGDDEETGRASEVPAALTLEQAQAMLAAAMANEGEDADAYSEADAEGEADGDVSMN